MEKQEETILVVGIALVYVLITVFFSFCTKLCLLIVKENKSVLKAFYIISPLWVIVMAGIIVLLIIYNKKYTKDSLFNLLHNSTIRMCSGLLVVIQGLMTLSSSIPTYMLSINSSFQVMKQFGQSSKTMLMHVIVSDIVSMIVLASQIFVGIYLIIFYDRHKKEEWSAK